MNGINRFIIALILACTVIGCAPPIGNLGNDDLSSQYMYFESGYNGGGGVGVGGGGFIDVNWVELSPDFVEP